MFQEQVTEVVAELVPDDKVIYGVDDVTDEELEEIFQILEPEIEPEAIDVESEEIE